MTGITEAVHRFYNCCSVCEASAATSYMRRAVSDDCLTNIVVVLSRDRLKRLPSDLV